LDNKLICRRENASLRNNNGLRLRCLDEVEEVSQDVPFKMNFSGMDNSDSMDSCVSGDGNGVVIAEVAVSSFLLFMMMSFQT